MAFGRELNDFVNGFQKGWTLVDNSQRTKAYSEQIKNAKDAKAGLAPKDEIAAYSAKHPDLPVTGDTLSTPGAIKPPAKTSAVPLDDKEETTASFEKGGRVSTYQKRFPPPGRSGAIDVPVDEQPYEGEEDDTFTPIGDRPSATEQARGAAPTPVFSRNTMARPEEAPAVGAREIVGDMPGRSRGMGGPPAYREWSAKDERARSRQGPRSNYGPSTGDSIMEIPEDETAPPPAARTHRMLPGVPRDSAPIGAVEDRRDPRDARPPSEVPTRVIGQRGVLQPLPPDVPDPRRDPQFATEPQHAAEGRGPYDGLGQQRDPGYRAGTGRGAYDDPGYPSQGYRAGTGRGAYDEPEPELSRSDPSLEQSPPTVRGTTPAAPPRGGGSAGRQTSPPAVPGATGGSGGGSAAAGGSGGAGAGGASRAAKLGAAAGAGLRSGAIPVEDQLVSQREIEANHMTPQQVQELSEARRAAQRQSVSRGEDPNQNINRPTAAQRQQLHVDIDHGHNAVDSAVAFLTKTFGLDNKGALPVAGAGPSSGGVQAVLRGEGSASPQEAQAVERTVDPNGEMSEARRVMLALAATHEWHLKNGRPKEAQTAAASLLQYYQLTAGRLSAISKVALAQGDVTGAVKAATHAYNMTPDGKELKTKVQPDGKTVAYRVTDLKDGKVTAEGTGPAAQLLSSVGTPLSYLTQAAGARKAGKSGGGGGGGGRKSSGGGSPGTPSPEAEAAFFAAKKALSEAEPGSPEAEKAENDMRAAYKKLEASVPLGKGKGASSAQYVLGNRGIKMDGTAGSAKSGGAKSGGAGTEGERAEAKADKMLDDLNAFDAKASRVVAGAIPGEHPGDPMQPALPSDRHSEAAATEIARRSAKAPDRPVTEFGSAMLQTDKARADINFNRKGGVEEFKPGNRFEDRMESYNKELDSLLSEVKPDASGTGDTSTKRTMDPNVRGQFLDIVDKVASKNDVGMSPRTLVRVIDSMANDIKGPAPQVDKRTGAVIYGNNKFNMDADTMTKLAALRGAAIKRLREATLAAEEKQRIGTETKAVTAATKAESNRQLGQKTGHETTREDGAPEQSTSINGGDMSPDALRERTRQMWDQRNRR